MPAYQTSGNISALYPGDQLAVWSAETPAVATASQQVALAPGVGESFDPVPLAIELEFSAAPGTFEVDVQTSDTDRDKNYTTLPSGGAITTVDATKFTARLEIPAGVRARFARLILKTAIQNAVTLIARITR